MKDTRARFESHYDRAGSGECWMWKARGRGSYKYGSFRLSSDPTAHSIGAHRAAWILYRGPIPIGVCVCHSCDTPGCVNPAHLFLGSKADNLADMHRKGREFRKLNAQQIDAIKAIRGPLPKVRAKELAAQFGVHWLYLYQLRKPACQI